MSNAAIKRARHQSEHGPRFTPGYCALQVRLLFDAPSSGDADGDEDADAVDVFLRAARADRHRVSVEALDAGIELPRAAPFLIAGGVHGNGHAVVTTGYGRGWGSKVWTPDTLRPGYWDRVDLQHVLGWVSHSTPLGWVETLGGKRVYFPVEDHHPDGPR